MKKIGICPSITKPESLKYVQKIASFLEKGGCEVFLDNDGKNEHDLKLINQETKLDAIVTIGGDGTLIHYQRKYAHLPHVMFTAVNLGKLGFMADVQVDEIETYLQDFLDDKYIVEDRLMLEGNKPGGGTFHAMNDIVLHRGSDPSMIQLKVTINDELFNTFQADGIIIATPTGSPAYSIACGGPLMYPTLAAFVLTPISGHTLTNRPFVIPDDSIIKVEYMAKPDKIIDVNADGIEPFQMKGGEIITINAAKDHFRYIHYNRHSFYKTVRKKLHWRGKSIA